ncbi:hypothetical protein D3C72_1101770 [compost metagenome]
MSAFKQFHHKVAIVARQHPRFVITFVDQIVEARLLAGKRERVRADVGGKKGLHRLVVFAKLNIPLAIVEVQHSVQGMVIR